METMFHLKKAATFGLLLIAGSQIIRAQTAPSATSGSASTSAASPGSEEVVTLQAFSVSADAAHGYVASESTTGTRIASKIADLPFSVDVVTSQFMEDFQLFTLNDQLALVSGFSPSEVQGQFQLRGFPSPITMVDGFRRIGLVDTVDISRIEVIKGSDASIYGATQPGGVVNIETRQPSLTQTDHFELGGGSDEFYRTALYSSGPMGNSSQWFYRVDMSDQFNKFADEFVSAHRSDIDGKILYKPDDKTNITFSFEHFELYEHPPAQVLTVTEKQTMPWAGNSITESQYYGMTTTGGLLNYNYQGPQSYDHNRVTSGTIDVEHRFSDVWSIKVGANAFTNPYNDQLVGSGAYYPYGTGNVTVVNGVVQQAFAPEVKDQPQADWKPQRGGSFQMDNLFAFSTGPVKNKLLITADYYELSQRTLTLVPLVSGSQATDYYALYSPYNSSGASYYTAASTWSPAMGYGWNTTLYGQNPSLYSGVSTDSWLASSDYGVFGSERASLLNDRVILMTGGRWDYVRNQADNYNIAPSGPSPALGQPEPLPYQAFDYNTSAWTYQLGALFKVVNGLNLYANKSAAFNPQPQIDTTTGLALPNNTSNGYEFGAKATLLDQKLNITASRFVINEFNLAVTETDPVSGLKDTVLNGQQQSKGYELDTNYQVTNDFYVQTDWGYANAKTVNGAALTFLDDLPVRRVPRNNVGVAIKYQFSSGFLRGLYLLADAKYYSKSLVNLGSGKSLVPGPASATVGSTLSMYYVAAQNLTYATGTDPKAAGETKITATPFNNVPFPGNGLLPFPSQPANALINYPVGPGGVPLPLANPATPGVYVGEPTGVYVDDGRNTNFNAPYALFDMGAGYGWRSSRTTQSVIRVSVKNMLNRAYTYGSGAPGLPLQLVTTYSLEF
jgi:outer membrane receptor protein involved in Fe transport